VEDVGTRLVQRLGIDSLRAEITMFEAARAYAAADGRQEVLLDDLKVVAPMALRLRQSPFMIKYFAEQGEEEKRFTEALHEILGTQDSPSQEGNYGKAGRRK
jgi:magnesium chelatase subunit I